jgi:DNA-directed RNA polymerase subunit RPC12/RpoP
MQTVNFPCGNCGNLMAVGTDYLGQQARCPHCQQVVLAPPPAAPPGPPTSPAFGPTDLPLDLTDQDHLKAG